MEKAVICHRGEVLEAWEHDDGWTVQLGELEASSRYLDLALAALLDHGESVHQLAARLLAQIPGRGTIRSDEPVATDALLGTHTKTAVGRDCALHTTSDRSAGTGHGTVPFAADSSTSTSMAASAVTSP